MTVMCSFCYHEKPMGEACPNGCTDQPTKPHLGHVVLYCARCGTRTDTRDQLGRCPRCAGAQLAPSWVSPVTDKSARVICPHRFVTSVCDIGAQVRVITFQASRRCH